METVTISPKFQFVIPQKVREEMGLRAGEEMKVFFSVTASRLFRFVTSARCAAPSRESTRRLSAKATGCELDRLVVAVSGVCHEDKF